MVIITSLLTILSTHGMDIKLSPSMARSRYEVLKCDARMRPSINNKNTLFIGDSITDNWSRDVSFRSNYGWRSSAVGGAAAEYSRWFVCRDLAKYKPSTVHIIFGTNDLAKKLDQNSFDQIAGYIASIALVIRDQNIRVVLGSIPPSADFSWSRGLNPAPKIVALNRWLKTFADGHCMTFVDYWSILSTKSGAMRPEYTKDGVHPNADAYRAMAPLALRGIAKANVKCRD